MRRSRTSQAFRTRVRRGGEDGEVGENGGTPKRLRSSTTRRAVRTINIGKYRACVGLQVRRPCKNGCSCGSCGCEV